VVRFPVRSGNSVRYRVQTGPGAHPASYPISTYSGVKRPAVRFTGVTHFEPNRGGSVLDRTVVTADTTTNQALFHGDVACCEVFLEVLILSLRSQV
jgi:hypothetical protein